MVDTEKSEGPRMARRGFDQEDLKWFSDKNISILKSAQEEVKWLLDRGYKMSSITEFIGGHYQLSVRQRKALQRATASECQVRTRRNKIISEKEICGKKIYIDGFNLIITLEVALSGGVLIQGNDGCIRDLAGLRGTYSVIDKTERALEIIGKTLGEFKVSYGKFFLDAPVSNSGRLKTRIMEHSNCWGFLTEVELVPNPDPVLSKLGDIATSDSIILDECNSWINLSRRIVEKYITDSWVINLES